MSCTASIREAWGRPLYHTRAGVYHGCAVDSYQHDNSHPHGASIPVKIGHWSQYTSFQWSDFHSERVGHYSHRRA